MTDSIADPKHEIYLDHAAGTYLDSRVKVVMEPYWEKVYGNPSSLYAAGRKAKAALTEARQTISHVLGCDANELIFTSSGTESDNLAILGVCMAWEASEMQKLSQKNESKILTKKRHIVTSSIEHHAVLNTCRYLESIGYEVTYLPVDKTGRVAPSDVAVALRAETLLVSIMYANNEVGTIQPIQEIATICHEAGVYCHTDACQAAGALSLKVDELGVDLMTLNASKIYGPKGVGLLYVRQGTKIKPILHGGGQEHNLRSGTENIPGIVGLAKALELVESTKKVESQRLTDLRHFFITSIMERIADVQLNGHPTDRLPNNINLTIPGVDGEAFILEMDRVGIACAAGSACDTATLEPSHVLLALGLSKEEAQSSIRFTFGQRTSKTDLEYVIKQMVVIVEKLRNRSS